MTTQGYAFEEENRFVRELTEALKPLHGSKMAAYRWIGGRIEVSERWVRRLAGRSESIRVDHRVALRLRDLHDRLCVRVAPAAALTAPMRPARPPAPALAFASSRTRGPAQASLDLNDLPLWQHPTGPR